MARRLPVSQPLDGPVHATPATSATVLPSPEIAVRAADAVTWANAAAALSVPAISVVVPTRNEAPNVGALLDRVRPLASRQRIEVLFVDDSDDDTPERIRVEGSPLPFGVRYVHRPQGQRAGGLGSAVVAGLKGARGAWACVMDGDLQHPPEHIERLVEAGRSANADVVVATRYRGGGSTGEFGLSRELVSRASSFAAKALFPKRLGPVSDQMSGFFAVRPAALELDSFRPQGFKILLEILVRSRELSVAEVPYTFGNRHAGESHASLREGGRFLRLLYDLRLSSGRMAHFTGFAVVGLTGFAVNLAATAAFTEAAGVPYLASAFLATHVSTTWNFVLTEQLVYRAPQRGSWWGRLLSFAGLNDAAFVVRGPMIYALTAGLGMHYLASTLTSLVALTVARFAIADRWIWTRERR